MSRNRRNRLNLARTVIVSATALILAYPTAALSQRSVEVVQPAVSFGDVQIGAVSVIPLTIRNTTNTPLSLVFNSAVLGGPNCSRGPSPDPNRFVCQEEVRIALLSFAIDVSGCDAIAPLGSCDVTVTFRPQGAFLMEGYLSVRDATLPVGDEARVVIVGAGTPAPSIAGAVLSVEYFNRERDHYFMTAEINEKKILDVPGQHGWVRSGRSFWVFPPGFVDAPSIQPICRFYGFPAAGLDSHFFSASRTECNEVVQRFSHAWLLETDDAFRAYLPDQTTGGCPTNTTPVYRVYNNRADVNHRYVTDLALRDQMLALGWIKEGYGVNAVAMCAVS